MNELQELIITAHKLSDTLSRMADNERKFGFDLCHLLEQVSYDMYKSASELREISSYIGV